MFSVESPLYVPNWTDSSSSGSRLEGVRAKLSDEYLQVAACWTAATMGLGNSDPDGFPMAVMAVAVNVPDKAGREAIESILDDAGVMAVNAGFTYDLNSETGQGAWSAQVPGFSSNGTFKITDQGGRAIAGVTLPLLEVYTTSQDDLDAGNMGAAWACTLAAKLLSVWAIERKYDGPIDIDGDCVHWIMQS